MADAAEMLTGLNSHYFVVLFGIAITLATIKLRYAELAGVLKWLAVVLFSYVGCALYIGPDWSAVLRDTFVPTLPKGPGGWAAIVAILGTTISPYLFFWQSSQEVEEEKIMGRTKLSARQGASPLELANRRLDVGVGTGFSNIVMYFIILSTALTLNRHGVTKVDTSRQVAEALRPLAGFFAEWLYTLGILGVGLLAIPTLAGSAAYAFAETFGWRQGLDRKLSRAKAFYGVLISATAAGIALDFANVSPVGALLDGHHQRSSCAGTLGRRPHHRIGSRAHERPAKLSPVARDRGSHGARHDRRRRRDGRAVAGRWLLSPPFTNL